MKLTLLLGAKYARCFHQYILNSQDEIIHRASQIVKGSTYKSYAPVSPASIIDASLPVVQYTLFGIFMFIMFLVACGLLKKWSAQCHHPEKGFVSASYERKVLEEYKESYFYALVDLLGVLRKKCMDEIGMSKGQIKSGFMDSG